MCMSSFLRGVAVGMLADAVLLENDLCPYPKTRKTAVGKAMQRMGNAIGFGATERSWKK